MKFVDFWAGFESENHWLLSQFSDKKKGTVYSVHGGNPETKNGAGHLDHPRVFFSVEPECHTPHKKRFETSDYSFSYHYGDGRTNPGLDISFQDHTRVLNFVANHGPKKVQEEIRRKNSSDFSDSGGKDVSMVYSNSKNHRRKAYEIFDKHVDIDSAGPFLNNMNGWTVPDDREEFLEFISQYEFYLAIENSRYPGYLTEKLYNALLADTIPIYWGDPNVGQIFNSDAFINVNELGGFENVVEKITNMKREEKVKILDSSIADPTHEMFQTNRFNNKISEI